jgi:hypothetical protein
MPDEPRGPRPPTPTLNAQAGAKSIADHRWLSPAIYGELLVVCWSRGSLLVKLGAGRLGQHRVGAVLSGVEGSQPEPGTDVS